MHPEVLQQNRNSISFRITRSFSSCYFQGVRMKDWKDIHGFRSSFQQTKYQNDTTLHKGVIHPFFYFSSNRLCNRLCSQNPGNCSSDWKYLSKQVLHFPGFCLQSRFLCGVEKYKGIKFKGVNTFFDETLLKNAGVANSNYIVVYRF